MPPEGLLEHDHQARLVRDFGLGLDLSPLYDRVRSRQGGPGRAAIDPRLCVALWLYATLEGVGSARALAWLCQHHNASRWLTGGVSVNHHTLSDFRVGHVEVLDDLLTHPVAVLRAQDLVDLNRVAQDGLRARASAASFRRRRTLEEHLAEARDQVARLKEEVGDDPAAPSRRQAAARQRAARERAERLRQALARLPELEAEKKAAERDKARASATDPEAAVMKVADGGFRPAFNIQYATATAGQVIVGVDVCTRGSDVGQTPPMVEQVQRRLGQRPKEWLADGGFVTAHEDIDAVSPPGADGSQTTVYAPVPKPRVAGIGRYAPHRKDSPAVAAWRARMATAEAQEVYRGRAGAAECVNARARNRGLARLPVRGAAKVKAVALWLALAHNVACGVRPRAGAVLAA